MKDTLLNRLFLYNTHIGHSGFFNSTFSEYFLGKRFDYIIFDLKKSFLFLKRALFFLKNLAHLNGSVLFSHTLFNTLELSYQCSLLSIAKRSNMPIITYP